MGIRRTARVVLNASGDRDNFALLSRSLGGLPVVNAVLDRLGLPALLAGALSAGDSRSKLAPAVAIRLVVTKPGAGPRPALRSG
jgi:hypothetical protein